MIACGNIKPCEPVFQPPSPIRKMKDLFGVVQSALRAIQSFFIQIEPYPDAMNQLREKVSLNPQERDKLGAALALSGGKCLSGSHLQTYAETLNSDRLNFSSLFCIRSNLNDKADLPSLPDLDKDLLALPVVVKGRFRDHVMIVVVDRENKHIEFYDSKGLTVNDRASERLTCYPSQTLKGLINKIWQKYAEEDWSFVENSSRHQSDGYNCGVYISHYLKQRVEGKSFEEIAAKGLSFKEAASSERSQMIHSIQSA